MDDRLVELERRMARTELRSRFMFAAGLLMLVCAVILMAAKPAVTRTNGSTVKAPFKVIDGQGKVLMWVDGHSPNGIAMLGLSNPTGGSGVWLGAGADGGFLQLHGNIGPHGGRVGGRVILQTVGEGGRLEILDAKGQLGASLAVARKNRLFVLYDKDENPSFRGGYGGMEPPRGPILP